MKLLCLFVVWELDLEKSAELFPNTRQCYVFPQEQCCCHSSEQGAQCWEVFPSPIGAWKQWRWTELKVNCQPCPLNITESKPDWFLQLCWEEWDCSKEEDTGVMETDLLLCVLQAAAQISDWIWRKKTFPDTSASLCYDLGTGTANESWKSCCQTEVHEQSTALLQEHTKPPQLSAQMNASSHAEAF